MSLTNQHYDEKLKNISDKNRIDSKNNIGVYNKEFNEFQKDGDINEIYKDLNNLQSQNNKANFRKRDDLL